MPMVLPATAALPKPVRMRTSPIHDAVATKFWNIAVPEMSQDAAHHRQVEPQVRARGCAMPAAWPRQVIELIEHAAAAADRRADGGAE